MRKIMILLAFLSLVSVSAMAQKTVSGAVTDENGEPAIGATVKIKGTMRGVVTDPFGEFTLTNVPEDAVIQVTYTGYKAVELPVASTTSFDVVLEQDAIGLGAVVKTAMNRPTERKELGYSVAFVDGEELRKTQSSSAMTALQGKVPGLKVSSSSGAPGASSKVVIRGYSSILGDNEPLYVVDGVPINNASNNFYLDGNSASRTLDMGNRGNDINPDDIEDITILKGASATALYGSRASNGVVMITTKKGQAQEGVKIDFSTGFGISGPLRLPVLQNTFGQGWSGHHALDENGSWGPAMDGKERPWGYVIDNTQQLKPFALQENNIRDFYERGKKYTNTLSLSGGNEQATYYVSYQNVSHDGVVPTDADSYNRNSLTFNGSIKGKRLTSSASVNYIKKKQSFVASGQGSSSNGASTFQELIQIPRDHSIVDMKDYNAKFYDQYGFYTPYADNPYYWISEAGNEWNEDRLIGAVNLDYRLFDWLSLAARVGNDVANVQFSDWGAATPTPDGSPRSSRSDVTGRVNERTLHVRETNADLLLNYNYALNEDLQLSGFAGTNVYDYYSRNIYAYVTNLDLPDYYNLANSSATPSASTTIKRKRMQSMLGELKFGYKDMLYLTGNIRNDWSSTLPKESNSYLYYGGALSFLFTELFDSEMFSYGKLRASIGKTGNDAGPHLLDPYMAAGSAYLPFGSVSMPLNGVNGFEVGNQLGSPDLQPEMTTEFEVGTELAFINDRVQIDAAFYKRNTVDQLFTIDIPATSGYTTQIANVGEVQNQGVEFMITLDPIRTKDFSWRITYNFSKNNNEVISLANDQEEMILTGAYQVDYFAIVGEPLGVFKVPQALTDTAANGTVRTVVNADGIPVTSDDKKVIGNAQADYLMGGSTTLRYKGLSASVAVDYRSGGMMYSYTKQLTYFVGNEASSVYNMRQPFLVPNSVQQDGEDTDGNPIYVENYTPIEMGDMNSYYYSNSNNTMYEKCVIDRTYFKIREINISYNLPKQWFASVPINSLEVSAYGSNVLLWTPEDNWIIDPEVTTWGSNALFSEFGEFAAGPTTRTFGGRLRISF